MPWPSWEALYRSDLQGTWALLVVPALFLVYAALAGRARADASSRPDARWLLAYSVVFAVETLVDPLATGPLVRALGLGPGAASAVGFLFVWLGDFRVLLLVFALARARRHAWLRAVVASLLVPALDLALYHGLLRALWPELPGQTLWLIHEVGFCALALALCIWGVPRLTPPEPLGHRRFLRGALLYAALYYALWAKSDLLILAGVDAGWGLRILPNQLYYACWVPFVFFWFTHRSQRG